jgi:hypothetical protein
LRATICATESVEELKELTHSGNHAATSEQLECAMLTTDAHCRFF